MENRDLTVINNEMQENNIKGELVSVQRSFCTLPEPETRENKILFYNAINSTPNSLRENVNKVIKIIGVYAEYVQVKVAPKKYETAPRMVIFDEEMNGYSCMSKGVFSSLSKIINIFGAPTPDNPITVMCKMISKGTNNILTLEIAE